MRPAELSALRANAATAKAWLVEGVWKVEHAFERSKAQGRVVDDTRLRICFVLALFGAAFVTLGIEAGRAALFGKPSGSGEAVAPPPGARADLVDREGRLLAVDLVHYGLYLDPRASWNLKETRAKLLAALPNLSRERLEKALASDRREYLVGALTPAERERVHDLGLPEVSFEEEQRRVYPVGESASHLIGFADSGGHGLAGAESALDPEVREAAAAGKPVALSIDLRVQAALEDELRGIMRLHTPISATGIVTNAKTGEVLALASLPDFNPNTAGQTPPADLVNHAAASVYEMGSTFKIFTFAMGLDSGVANVNSTFDASEPLKIGDRTIHDYHGVNRVMSLEDVFIHSSNIGTAKLGLRAGGERLKRYFDAFGLLAPARVELSESARPILPRTWNEDVVASASFGAAISVSPLAVAGGVGAVMNGGTYVPLTILKETAAPKGRRVISPEASRAMLDLMRANVLRGTGTKADAPGLRVGGKTGSAEKAIGGRYERNKLVSSFAAVFPTDGPVDATRYVVLIMVDEPKGVKETFGFATGGWAAAPAAGRVIDRIAPFLGVRRTPTAPFAAQRQAAAPAEEVSEGTL